jgi:NADPH-dependent ferric siderophore reductase
LSPEKRGRRPRVVRVEEAGWLTPGMVRLVLGGDGFEGFEAAEFTDQYVKLQLPPPGADYAPPFDPVELRESRPREQWPRTRTFTVRAWDPAGRRLTLDFVVHGEEGIAGPWAARAKPGDLVQLLGPGGAYAPDPGIATHVLVGDESALPAVAAALERIPAGRTVLVLAQLRAPGHALELHTAAELELDWLLGHDERAVLDAVRALSFPPDATQAFVHGEASMVRAVRRHLLVERGLPLERLSASGYWKRGRTDEGWREEKPEWKRLAEEDLASAGH